MFKHLLFASIGALTLQVSTAQTTAAVSGFLPDSCQPNTFLKVYGEIIKQDNIAALRAAPDGNIYVAGGKADGYAIGKMTPEGNMIWLRSITGAIQNRTFVTEIIVDSEGMIAGCGRMGSNSNETIAFRYNPVTNQTLWERRLGNNNPTDGGILEKKPGGNFLIYQSPQTSPLGYKSGELLELSRTTGQVVPAFGKRYAQQINQVFAGMVLHEDALYATGHTDSLLPFNQSARRMTLTKLDANTGNVLWTRLGLTPWSQTSHFRGIDLIVDDNSLIVLSHGIETSNTITGPGKEIPVYLHKTTLDGQVLWAQKYLLSEVPREVVAVPDGYVIFCGNIKRILLKTDKAGNLLFAKALNTPDYFSAGYEDWQKNQIERVGSYLYITDFTAKANTAGQFTTVLKTDLNLGMEFNCDLEFLAVSDTTMTIPVLFAAQQTVTISPASAQAVTLNNAPGSIAVHQACPFCPDPPCTDKPDITFQIESVGCDSAAFITYRLCNTGKQPFAGTLQVGVYDTNPTTSAATLLDLFFLPNLNLPPDSCQTGTLKNLAYWGNYSKVYTLAGIESGQSTPVDPAGFPYNGIAECDYANNLDSLNFQYPPAPLLNLGPNTDICPGDSLLLGTGLNGFVSYTWQDGSHGSTFWVKGEGFFTLNTVDGCGRTASDNISIGLKKQPKATREYVLLPGDSVVIGGVVYNTSAQVISYETSTMGGCDTLVTNNIRLDSLHCDRPGAFFKTYKGMGGRVLVPAAGGGYYVGGNAQVHALAKFDATGKNLWVRQFGFFGDHFIQTLIEDSEGMLVGSATSEGGTSSILAFRYDPLGDQMLWVRRFSAAQMNIRGHELVEKNPGGDFLLSYRLQITATDFRTEMVSLNRVTGAVVSNWRYDSRVALTSIEVNKGFLYASGVLEDTVVASLAWRGGLVKIDLGTGAPVWSRLIKASDANLFGGNLLVDATGNAVSTMAQAQRTFALQKTAPDGNLVWMKKIQFADPDEHHFFPLGIALVKDGYLIGIQTYSDSTNLHSYIVVKTDLNGVLLWSKKVPHVGNLFTLSPHQFAARGYEGCLVTNTHAAVFQQTGMVLAKFDRQGRLGEGCPVALETPVTISAQPGIMQPAKIIFTTVPRVFEPVMATASEPTTVLQNTACSRCLPPCQPIAVQEVIEFYPGDTITIGSTDYTQSDTAVQILCTDDGCDSVVTYVLRLVVTNLDLACPANLTVTIPATQSSAPVTYPQPAAATDCPVPMINMTRLQGPPTGGVFSVGTTLVCFEAANQCGIRDTCCFTVSVQKNTEETACDVKNPPGSCIRFELLNIRLDSLGRPRYRFRLTNTCASPLKYACFQLPNGMTAKAPLEGATYTAPGGNTYLVRNPNAAPFHSVRFKPLSGNLINGQSDIFEYTLPKQAQPAFILVSIKLADGSTYDAHLNTFACPVQPYVAASPPTPLQRRGEEHQAASQKNDNQTNRNTSTTPPLSSGEGSGVRLRPNPTSGLLFVDLPGALVADQPVLVSVLNAQGQLVLEGRFAAENNQISLRLPDGLANGLYYLTAQPVAGGVRSAVRFVLER
ncbi:MAG: HYR domain-containing protein [Saprospiraceae bacterium]